MGRGKGFGALEFLEGLMVVAYGGVLIKGGRLFLSVCLLWWEMVLVFFSGMISRLGRILLKLFILSYICVQPIKKFVFLKC